MIAGRAQPVGGPIAVTDDRGAYRISGLDPARYIVAALSVQHTVLDTIPDGAQTLAVGELATGGIGGQLRQRGQGSDDRRRRTSSDWR